MKKAHIEAWAEQNHFLEVDIDGKTMKITPLSYEPLHIVDVGGASVQMPFTVTLPQSRPEISPVPVQWFSRWNF